MSASEQNIYREEDTDWTAAEKVDTLCSKHVTSFIWFIWISLVEFMVVKCRPFYLPREFTAIVIVAVYIPPCANAKDALRELYSAISEQQTNNPDGFFIIAGDFNHANLKSVLTKFYQHVNFATRGNNTLDFVYTTVKNAYKAEPRPHLGYSDHISVMLTPAYRPLLKLAKLVQKQITAVVVSNEVQLLRYCT